MYGLNPQYISSLQPSCASVSIIGVAGAPAMGEVVRWPLGFGPDTAFSWLPATTRQNFSHTQVVPGGQAVVGIARSVFIYVCRSSARGECGGRWLKREWWMGCALADVVEAVIVRQDEQDVRVRRCGRRRGGGAEQQDGGHHHLVGVDGRRLRPTCCLAKRRRDMQQGQILKSRSWSRIAYVYQGTV